jgi:hypothetical protein
MDCENCSFPSLAAMFKNLSVSVVNAVKHASITGSLLADENKIQDRMTICNYCPAKINNKCAKCGCYINLKIGLDSEKCPKGKW